MLLMFGVFAVEGCYHWRMVFSFPARCYCLSSSPMNLRQDCSVEYSWLRIIALSSQTCCCLYSVGCCCHLTLLRGHRTYQGSLFCWAGVYRSGHPFFCFHCWLLPTFEIVSNWATKKTCSNSALINYSTALDIRSDWIVQDFSRSPQHRWPTGYFDHLSF